MQDKEQALIWCIAYRYQRLVKQHGLLPTRTDEELLQRLREAHKIQPLDLSSIIAAADVDLVIAVGDIDLHYCPDSQRIKDNFISPYSTKSQQARRSL